MDKIAILQSLIGKPYDLRRNNCWHTAGEVLRKLYGVELPRFRPRDAISSQRRIAAMESFSGWDDWKEIDRPQDGAILLIARARCVPDLHAGVYIDLGMQSGVLHNDDPPGQSTFDDFVHFRNRGMNKIRFFVRA